MHAWHRVTLVLLLLASPLAAQSTVGLTFRVMPPGATVQNQDNNTEVAPAPSEDIETVAFHVDIDSTTPHHFVIRRPPFDDRELLVTWDPQRGHWVQPDGAALVDNQRIDLTRTLHFNTVPGDATAYTEAVDTNDPGGQVLNLEGLERRVVPLQKTAGGWIVPSAWRPPVIYLSHPGFHPHAVSIAEGALATPGDVWPPAAIPLTPQYGPFSYVWFDVGLAVVATLAGGLWVGILRPSRRHRRAVLQREDLLASRLLEHRSNEPVSGGRKMDFTQLTGREVPINSGEVFVLMEVLGQGGMGVVYHALSKSLDRPAGESWAIKILTQDRWHEPEFQARFKREVRVGSILVHPNVVKLLDWGLLGFEDRSGAYPFIVMEMLEGRTLRDFQRDRKGQPLSISQVLGWLEDMLTALTAVHGQGIIHRDLKPENVMVLPSGHLKLMDFGIARDLLGEAMTKTNLILGTPRYMSPEHLNAKTVTAQSDLYSVGVMAYEFLSGAPPYQADDPWELIGRMLSGSAMPLGNLNPELSKDLSNWVMRMMAVEREERFASAAAALEALPPR